MSTSFWINEPSILLKQTEVFELYPSSGMHFEKKLNAITRLIILLTILGYLVTQKTKFLITGIITLVVIIVLYKIQSKKHIKKDTANKEGFISA